MIVSEGKVEKAVNYLADTEERYATAKALIGLLKEQRKSVKASLYMSSDMSAQSAKEQDAYSHHEYKTHLTKIYDAELDYELLRAKRTRAEQTIDLWRTCEASRRRGNL